jgi:uncharacterized phage protein (TIGR01671 family)
MNRQIKFRVWDNQNNDWLINQRIEDYPVELLYSDHKFYIAHSLSNLDNYVIQQYTGLLDKNGIDIYEGDVLKCKGFDGWFDTVGFYYNVTVKYNTVESGDSHIAGFAYIPMDREVIGNIFENSELLK